MYFKLWKALSISCNVIANLVYQHINQVTSGVRIGNALWPRLCIVLLVNDVEQFSFQSTPKSAK